MFTLQYNDIHVQGQPFHCSTRYNRHLPPNGSRIFYRTAIRSRVTWISYTYVRATSCFLSIDVVRLHPSCDLDRVLSAVENFWILTATKLRLVPTNAVAEVQLDSALPPVCVLDMIAAAAKAAAASEEECKTPAGAWSRRRALSIQVPEAKTSTHIDAASHREAARASLLD